MKIKILAGAAALLLMSACASDAPAPSPPPPSYRPPPPPPPPADQCGAAEAQKYVGRPRSEIPIPVLPALQRVACTTCPVTMDYSARRLNFYYDAQTGIVKEVKCG
ncbi:MAG: peptidase inhibitor I78 [Phenylobacterium sp.]|uniref:peptidase inhibitor I78 n=1 Tax=Phenylobacterium sp. TaxID=1871053 RepID=UPI0027313F17|nr:peptidase inhibitor I78 [Phenylobacterium sp.]MDP2011395.1 peptidase inhibitor I78 [Phenylobacterium sp.]MDP3632652.1 peptidase inhibitor I78 [Phenylobacterium sp.]MDP3867955.1 peptidase inhibitor I78 [Phenylobacterium sp.]